MREVKVGDNVVYQQGEGDPPMAPVGRKHPALVCAVGDGGLNLVIFPFHGHSHYYRGVVPRGKPDDERACWYFPEEG